MCRASHPNVSAFVQHVYILYSPVLVLHAPAARLLPTCMDSFVAKGRAEGEVYRRLARRRTRHLAPTLSLSTPSDDPSVFVHMPGISVYPHGISSAGLAVDDMQPFVHVHSCSPDFGEAAISSLPIFFRVVCVVWAREVAAPPCSVCRSAVCCCPIVCLVGLPLSSAISSCTSRV
mmetsp:Transcript_4473/g.13546  ORF Transcript_4473/g.13546 Transcript_4473/m.13546 type:complete len:175 (+) Transcript_4473:130-654(+)